MTSVIKLSNVTSGKNNPVINTQQKLKSCRSHYIIVIEKYVTFAPLQRTLLIRFVIKPYLLQPFLVHIVCVYVCVSYTHVLCI